MSDSECLMPISSTDKYLVQANWAPIDILSDNMSIAAMHESMENLFSDIFKGIPQPGDMGFWYKDDNLAIMVARDPEPVTPGQIKREENPVWALIDQRDGELRLETENKIIPRERYSSINFEEPFCNLMVDLTSEEGAGQIEFFVRYYRAGIEKRYYSLINSNIFRQRIHEIAAVKAIKDSLGQRLTVTDEAQYNYPEISRQQLKNKMNAMREHQDKLVDYHLTMHARDLGVTRKSKMITLEKQKSTGLMLVGLFEETTKVLSSSSQDASKVLQIGQLFRTKTEQHRALMGKGPEADESNGLNGNTEAVESENPWQNYLDKTTNWLESIKNSLAITGNDESDESEQSASGSASDQEVTKE